LKKYAEKEWREYLSRLESYLKKRGLKLTKEAIEETKRFFQDEFESLTNPKYVQRKLERQIRPYLKKPQKLQEKLQKIQDYRYVGIVNFYLSKGMREEVVKYAKKLKI
jgi:uncharacterized membrane protein